MDHTTNSTKEKLRKVSTATIATCLFKKGLKNQFIQDIKPLKLGKPTMVGEAYTLRYIPAREDLNTIEVFKDPKHLQRVAVEECPIGAILVIDSRRDSAEIAELHIPSYHHRPSAPTNLTLHQAIAINEPIGCGGVAVFPGDILVGDDDGVMVVPAGIADEVANECLQMTLFEEFVMENVQNGRSIVGLYPLVDNNIAEEYGKWKVDKQGL